MGRSTRATRMGQVRVAATALGFAWSLLVGCGATTVKKPDGSGGGGSGGTAGASQTGGTVNPQDCYSPTQNADRAYDPGAMGCACDPAKDVDVCVNGTALICDRRNWEAVEDGPCAPSAQVACGGRAGSSCSASQYCGYEAGSLCGAADAESVCKPRPTTCIDIYAPVCGCDQMTYPNSCVANLSGTGVLAASACPN